MDFASRNLDVVIRCDGCRYRRVIPIDELIAVFSLGAKVWNVERRLKCTRCSHKGASLGAIPRLPERP